MNESTGHEIFNVCNPLNPGGRAVPEEGPAQGRKKSQHTQ